MNLEKFKVLIVLVTMSFCGNCYCQESAHDEGSELATIVPEVSPPTTYDLLNEPGVQKDLELSEDQTKQVWTINSEFGHQMIASNKSLHEGNMSVEDYKVLILARRAAYQNHLDGLLLPHQLKRIQQLAIQTHINQVGTCNAISSKLVVDELNISEEQKRELIERSKAIEKTLAEEIERLKTKAKDELLSVLSDEQRTKLTELTGDKYNPKNTDWEEGRQAYNRFIQQRK